METELKLFGTVQEIQELLGDAAAHRHERANKELCGAIHTIRKIPAIKLLRDELGISLIDGKRIVELMIEKSKR